METHKGRGKSAFRLVSELLDDRDITFEDVLAIGDEPALLTDGADTASDG